jgi:hypothetical protein
MSVNKIIQPAKNSTHQRVPPHSMGAAPFFIIMGKKKKKKKKKKKEKKKNKLADLTKKQTNK